jgi:hypothetical protein
MHVNISPPYHWSKKKNISPHIPLFRGRFLWKEVYIQACMQTNLRSCPQISLWNKIHESETDPRRKKLAQISQRDFQLI